MLIDKVNELYPTAIRTFLQLICFSIIILGISYKYLEDRITFFFTLVFSWTLISYLIFIIILILYKKMWSFWQWSKNS